ncbi:MAG: hypothetical protein RLZZ253_1167, partial [Verrucomicrobiota bacterium]
VQSEESLPLRASLYNTPRTPLSIQRKPDLAPLPRQKPERRFSGSTFLAFAGFRLAGFSRKSRSRRPSASSGSRRRLMSGFDPQPPSRGTPSATLPRAPRLHQNHWNAARPMPAPGPSAAYRIPESEYPTLPTARPFGSQPISTTDWLFCDSSAAAKISWVATASCGVAHPNRPSKRPSRSAK